VIRRPLSAFRAQSQPTPMPTSACSALNKLVERAVQPPSAEADGSADSRNSVLAVWPKEARRLARQPPPPGALPRHPDHYRRPSCGRSQLFAADGPGSGKGLIPGGSFRCEGCSTESRKTRAETPRQQGGAVAGGFVTGAQTGRTDQSVSQRRRMRAFHVIRCEKPGCQINVGLIGGGRRR